MANIITAGNSTNGGTAITTDTSGTLNIVTGSGSGSNAITIDTSQAVTMPGTLAVTGAQTIGGNLTVSGTLTASGGVSGGIRSGTAVTASGTSIDFTSLPTGIKRITVMFSGVSTNGSSIVQIRLGTSGGVVSTGYIGRGDRFLTIGSAASVFTSTANSTGFNLENTLTTAAASARDGMATICLQTGNTWVLNSYYGATTGESAAGTGYIALGGTLDRIRITTVNGTDTFDAGTINIFYE